MLRRGILVITLALSASSASAEPWFERPKCDQIEQLVMGAEFDKADAQLKLLEASRDADDQACGVWLRMSMTEFQIAHLGRTPAMLAQQEKMLGRIFGFAKAHEKLAIRFHDLEMEARLRRIRVLFDAERRSEAVKEAQRVRAMLDEKRVEAPTPTVDFVSGNVNAVIAYSSWAVRTLLKVGGLSGDGAAGEAALKRLGSGPTIYRYEALYVSRHFAEDPESGLGKSSDYSAKLFAAFPGNPALCFDYASDLWLEKAYPRSMEVLTPMLKALSAEPSKWTSVLRAKVYGLGAAQQLQKGDKPEAKRLLELAKAQGFEEQKKELERIEDGLKD